jgi:hypothetical protein
LAQANLDGTAEAFRVEPIEKDQKQRIGKRRLTIRVNRRCRSGAAKRTLPRRGSVRLNDWLGMSGACFWTEKWRVAGVSENYSPEEYRNSQGGREGEKKNPNETPMAWA